MFKRKLTLLLALLMVFSTIVTVGAAKLEFDELPTKIQWLVEEKYVEGRPDFERYGEKDMALDQTIERAEMTKLLILSMGYTTEQVNRFAEEKGIFPDVPQNYWANGFVNVAVRDKIVEGHEDGEFKPAWNITFAELSAMLVRMDKRWDSRQEASAQWPNTYINTAREYGILNDIKEPTANTAVKREMAFEMFYNHLNYTEDREGQVKITYDYNIKNMPNYKENRKDYEDEKDLKTVEIFVDKDKEIGVSNLPKDVKVYNRETGKDMRPLNWNTKKDGTGENLTKDTKLTKDTTFYAIWTGYIDNRDVKVDDVKAPIGTSFRDLERDYLPRKVKIYIEEGRDKGWNEWEVKWEEGNYDRDSKVPQYIRGEIDRAPKDYKGSTIFSVKVTLDDNRVRVEFNAMDGKIDGEKTKTVYVEKGKSLGSDMPKDPTPNDKDKEFAGWGIDGIGGVKFTKDTKVEKNLYVYADYKKKGTVEEDPKPDTPNTYKVTFDYNDGKGTKKETLVEKGKNVIKPETPVREHYNFNGWKLGTKDWDFEKDTVSKNITLVADWTQTHFKVTITAGEGTLNEGYSIDEYYKVGDTLTLPSNDQINAPKGKKLAGWSINGSSSLESPAAQIKISNTDTNIIAVYVAK